MCGILGGTLLAPKIRTGDLPYPPGMTEKEYGKIIDDANNQAPVFTKMMTAPSDTRAEELIDVVDSNATKKAREKYAKNAFQQWMDDNPDDRYRLGVLAAKGQPIEQLSRSPQGAANPRTGASAASQSIGSEGGGATGASESFELGSGALLQQKRKNLLGV